ncbi:hypothetical protein L249_0339 [Ophiocordyceps polyrhachis-furcata BCC 54312]|uniref:Mitochondrial carrier protein n=1 Tax=Ophiocordyceps polyrhachis-furcata BCC 54312 TaxID=1330021 RepID=A0A367LDR7_9HYPO|nr:hypothetical protein L249_0339 [Ophiocordyceps polyrhachis-furcata BCC 54312]
MQAVRRAAMVTTRRCGFTTSTRFGLKESSSQTDVDYDQHKQDSLAKQRQGNAHWKPELASDSEEAVKADRAGGHGARRGKEDISRLQEQTKKMAEEKAKAGGTSALAGTVVDVSLFPLDAIKTRLQSSSGFFAAGGFARIYRGVGSAVVGSAPGAAFFFCSYEAVKKRLLPREDEGEEEEEWPPPQTTTTTTTMMRRVSLPEPLTHVVAASVGEVAACAVRVPVEVVKQRAQAGLHGGSSASAFRAILAGYKKPAIGRGGLETVWRELYRGWGITVFRELPFTAIQFPLWEAMKHWRRRALAAREEFSYRPDRDSSPPPHRFTIHDVSAMESAVFGSLAGAVAAGLTTPLDVVKTRVMLSSERVSVRHVIRAMIRNEGWRPFFAGIVPRVTWISIGGAIFLGSYQWAINTFNTSV